MYFKLARGYATQYVNRLADHSAIRNWIQSDKRRRAINTFEESALSKKPGRTEKRLAPLLRPAFTQPFVGYWTKDMKMILARSVTAAQENAVFDLSKPDAPRFEERSVFLSNLFLSLQDDEIALRIITSANIGHHALARLLERGLATPQTLPAHIKWMLAGARNIALTMERSSLELDKPYAFLIPYKDGALPAVTMEVQPDKADNTSRQLVVSIRTFLDETMLTREHRERMGGFAEAQEAITSDTLHAEMVKWVETNARPWIADADGSQRQTDMAHPEEISFT